MDSPFEDALRDLRVSGNVLLTGTHAAPWAVDVPGEAKLRALLRARRGQRIIPFHLVRRGRFDLSVRPGRRLRVRAGEAAFFPGGTAHQMRLGSHARAVRFAHILSGEVPPRAGPADRQVLAATVGQMGNPGWVKEREKRALKKRAERGEINTAMQHLRPDTPLP